MTFNNWQKLSINGVNMVSLATIDGITLFNNKKEKNILLLTLIDGTQKEIDYTDPELTLNKIQEIDPSITKENLKSIDSTPSSCDIIGVAAFRYCNNLTTVTISDGIERITDYAFELCDELTDVRFSSTVTRVSVSYAFSRSNKLSSFSVADDNPSFSSINNLICSKDGKRLLIGVNDNVVIPSIVERIEDYAFMNRGGLISIFIPSSVSQIGYWSFYSCSKLTSIILPQSIIRIGHNAFCYCDSMTQAKFEGKTMSQIRAMSDYPWGLNEDIIVPGLIEVSLSSSDQEKGSVEGSGTYENGSSVIIKAIPKDGCIFESWSDGNIDAERTLTLNSDVSLSAAFEIAIPEDILAFTASEDGSSIKLNAVGSPISVSLEYYDGSWKDYEIGYKIEIPNGSFICMRAKDENATFSKDINDRYRFSMTGKIAASGNIQYLLKKDGSRTDAPAYCYYQMFEDCKSLTAAPELPATTLADYCYEYMFFGCASLTTAPKLPATTLAIRCYYRMFFGCTYLTTAPELPATTLAGYCYYNMFNHCTSLISAPELPATSLANGCYYYMFNGCKSLTTAPELPATTLANFCYSNMFQGCTSLTSAPKLPATTLANSCYYGIFENCPKITDIYIPNLTELEYNTEKVAKNSGDLGREGQAIFHYKEILPEDILTFTASEDESSITLNAVGSPISVSLEYYDGSWKDYEIGYKIEIPNGSSIYMRAKDKNATFSKDDSNYYQFSMTGNIAASGSIQYLLKKDGSRTDVPANCYTLLFADCTSLTSAPELPATTLASNCYGGMFFYCTSLTTAPDLPAMELAGNCYNGMFFSCISLTSAPELPATTLAENCYYAMFYECTSLTSTPELPATTLDYECYEDMFDRCTKVIDIYIPNLTEPEYNTEKAAKYSGNLGREGQAIFHFKDPILRLTLTDETQKKLTYTNSSLNIYLIQLIDNSISIDNLKSIDYIPLNVKNIDVFAFDDCGSLISIKIPVNVTTIGLWAFATYNRSTKVIFEKRTISQIKSIDNYPWGLIESNIIPGIQ